MAKKHRNRQPRPAVRRPAESTRQTSLDAVRGLAILLMVVDHAAQMLFGVERIAPDTVRGLTRLAMPLFCGLMGYFLARSVPVNWSRMIQLALAAGLVNVAFFPIFGVFDILVSLWLCALLTKLLRQGMCLMVPVSALVVFDPTREWLDFPLTVVMACVAQGVVLRTWGVVPAIVASLVTSATAVVVPTPTAYILWCVTPAMLLIVWARTDRSPAPRWLCMLGRYPLTAYVAQYYIILVLSQVWRN